jgi:hypothetical protein
VTNEETPVSFQEAKRKPAFAACRCTSKGVAFSTSFATAFSWTPTANEAIFPADTQLKSI